MNLILPLRWTARSCALITVMWCGALAFQSVNFLPLLLFIVAIAVTTTIAWQNEAVGGALFLILDSIYFLILVSNDLSYPYLPVSFILLASGIIFLTSYFYSEKKEREDDDF